MKNRNVNGRTVGLTPSSLALIKAVALPNLAAKRCDSGLQIILLRLILLGACLVGMLLSAPLWMNGRPFPVLPVAGWFPLVPVPWDAVLFGGTLFALALAMRFYRPGVTLFLIGGFWLVLQDQNRLQPWFYLYAVMLALTLFRESVALAGCRVAVSALYVWAGWHKFNPAFFQEVSPFIAAPLMAHLPPWGGTPALWLCYATPLLELFVGLGLWFPASRRLAIGLVVGIHAVALFVLGPSGNQFNAVVWPWNVAMVLLVLVLFAPAGGDWRSLVKLRESRPGFAVVTLFCLLPALSYWGWWDSYLSFRLYSGNTDRAAIILSASARQRLPARLRPYTSPANLPSGSAWTGAALFDLRRWAEAELGVPPLPEARSYRALADYLAVASGPAGAVRLVLEPRHGPVQIYDPHQPGTSIQNAFPPSQHPEFADTVNRRSEPPFHPRQVFPATSFPQPTLQIPNPL
jgi:hypothetical protein